MLPESYRNAVLVSALAVLVAVGLAVPPAASAQDASITVPARAARKAAPPWTKAALWGGDVRSLAIHPDDPDTVYAGTSAGQLYVSADGGRTWADAGLPLPFPGWVVSDLEFDPERPGRMWAGLWGIWGGGHVSFSDDGGRTWLSRATGIEDNQVYALATVPDRRDRLYAGTLNGVYRSDDAGLTWERVTNHLPEVYKVTSLWVDPRHPETVFAGTWQRAYRSDDGGLTWRGVFQGMLEDSEVFAMRPRPGHPGELWASTCGWVYQSRDMGGSWVRHKEGFENRRTPSFEALPGGRLLAGTVGGLHVSDDDGRHWRRVGPAELAIHAIAYHPRRPERVFFGTEGSGVWVSRDGGTTVERLARGMTNLRVAALVSAGREVLAAVNHAGPASGIYSSRDGGRSFEGAPGVVPTVLSMAVHGASVYAGTERGLWERSGDAWRKIGEIGDRRIEGLATSGDRLVVRTSDGLWEKAVPRFRPVPYEHGAPRGAELLGGALWVSDGDGLYRLTEGTNDTLPAPAKAGRLGRLGDRLLLWGKDGAWVRETVGGAGGTGGWAQLLAGPVQVLATGDARYPALLVGRDDTLHLAAADGALTPVDFPFANHVVSSALIHGNRLLIGTLGQGLVLLPLPTPR
ncbi:MAG TPA: hypothetical protein VHQ65_05720 [Thermoanaerobaculia bacterium]|nr:hypothetical protein [Thermoanaerobaculia bacterium]